jgi:hypothetical protein
MITSKGIKRVNDLRCHQIKSEHFEKATEKLTAREITHR